MNTNPLPRKLSIDELVTPNIPVLRGMTEERLRAWLLVAFSGRDFSPFTVYADLTLEQQLSWLFQRSAPNDQEKLKAALVGAVGEWLPDVHGLPLLTHLVYLAASIRASGAVPLLIRHLETRRIQLDGREQSESAVRAIVTVTGGFPDVPVVKGAFEKLFFDDSLAQFAATMFNTLCTLDKDNFYRYLPRMLLLFDRHPQFYRPKGVLNETMRRLGPASLQRQWPLIANEWISKFLYYLADEPPAPMVVGAGRRGAGMHVNDLSGRVASLVDAFPDIFMIRVNRTNQKTYLTDPAGRLGPIYLHFPDNCQQRREVTIKAALDSYMPLPGRRHLDRLGARVFS